MKNLNNYITEKLKLNKDTKIINYQINTKFDGVMTITNDEINTVMSYATQLKVKPVVLTNYLLIRYHKLYPYKNYICMYYDKGWENYEKQNNYICLLKDEELNNKWYAIIVINNNSYCLMNNNKTVLSLNVEDVCDELIKYLDKNPEFYNKIKKN